MAIHIRRREFISTLCGAAVAWPLAARAQQSVKLRTIGFSGQSTRSAESDLVAAFTQCQRRSKNASAGRSKNTSVMLARRPPKLGSFVRHQAWVGLSTGVSELARCERRLL